MQNPVYNGTNRIVLYCTENPELPSSFCSRFAKLIESKFRMKVNKASSKNTEIDNSTSQRPFGILEFHLETLSNENDVRVRVVLINSNDQNKFEGNWVRVSSDLSNKLSPEELGTTLLKSLP